MESTESRIRRMLLEQISRRLEVVGCNPDVWVAAAKVLALLDSNRR